MKNLALAASLISITFLAACSGNDTPAFDSSLSSSTDSAVIAPANGITPVLTDSTINVVNPGAQVTLPSPASTATPSATTVPASKPAPVTVAKSGLNPAHGEPGHRCDINVGAPLNSAPSAVAPSNVQSAPVISQPAIQAKPATSVVPSGSSPKINPPHGQPGHDCAVQVGAPLKN